VIPPTSPPEQVESDALFPAVYAELKRIARHQLRVAGGKTTLSTTDLVHEAFLKLEGNRVKGWENRAHFFGAASSAMRHVLVDLARRRRAAKRGGAWRVVSLGEAEAAVEVKAEEILDLDEALVRLDGLNQRLRQVVELRFFGGVPEEDIARMLKVSSRTVERDWLKARLFLLRELRPDEGAA
jgi:RNA polymerase sigma factor (TIGR02999 family)